MGKEKSGWGAISRNVCLTYEDLVESGSTDNV